MKRDLLLFFLIIYLPTKPMKDPLEGSSTESISSPKEMTLSWLLKHKRERIIARCTDTNYDLSGLKLCYLSGISELAHVLSPLRVYDSGLGIFLRETPESLLTVRLNPDKYNFEYLPCQVETIDVSNNKLQYLNILHLQKLFPLLKRIIASHNSIRNIDSGGVILNGLEIDLRYNPTPKKIIEHLQSLRPTAMQRMRPDLNNLIDLVPHWPEKRFGGYEHSIKNTLFALFIVKLVMLSNLLPNESIVSTFFTHGDNIYTAMFIRDIFTIFSMVGLLWMINPMLLAIDHQKNRNSQSIKKKIRHKKAGKLKIIADSDEKDHRKEEGHCTIPSRS